MQASLSDALRDRYVLERELGRGGMATVYLAHDLKHDRPVALKVLHPEMAASVGTDRFQREIRLAARLQHPHILTVLDSGEAAGQLWFTMPYVEGESLRDRLRRERQLPIEDALRITREAAQGLQYAHEHGVVHRDIKPENILLTQDGSTLVADFGIARALWGDDRLTATGIAIGTPAYMSPEQASADQTIDVRTDVYALGTVLYEMLAGEPPFTGPTAQAIIGKRLTQPASSVRHTRPNVSESVDAAIAQALARIAADRFASAGDFARALTAPTTAKRPVPVAALMLVLGVLLGLGVLFAWRRTHESLGERGHAKRIAVLPFENLGDSADGYFADGMTDEVRGKLSQLSEIAVIARASSNEYRRSAKPPQQIARELGAEYLLTATVRWEKTPGTPSRVRVSTELVQVEPSAAPTAKWQQGFDASLTDVFQVQTDIASKVAGALNVALGDRAGRELAARPTSNVTAYDAFLKGEAAAQGMSVSDPPSIRRAVGYYEQAVALDSAFVPAWAQLARARALLFANSTPIPEVAVKAREAAERAKALAPDRPDGQLALGDYYRVVARDPRQSLAAVEPGLKLSPNNVDLLVTAALAEERLGRWEAASQHLAGAGVLDPRSVNTARRTGITLLNLRRYAKAQAEADRAFALAPTNLAVIQLKTSVRLAQGDLAGARAVVRAALGTVEPAALLAYFGNYDDLYWVLEDAQQRQLLALKPSVFDNDRATWAIVLAQTYAVRGNQTLARAFADSARLVTEEQLRATPNDAQRHVFHGLELAYVGRKTEAIAEGERAVALMPISRDNFAGAYLQHQLVRIYVHVGEAEKALDRLEPLLRMPYRLSPGWLRIDPTFAPLRGNPRFERLIN